MNQDQSIKNRQALAPYKQAISRYIRSAMALKGTKYNELTTELAKKGVIMTPENLRSKVSKGMFSADLFAAIIDALQVKEEAMSQILSQLDHD